MLSQVGLCRTPGCAEPPLVPDPPESTITPVHTGPLALVTVISRRVRLSSVRKAITWCFAFLVTQKDILPQIHSKEPLR